MRWTVYVSLLAVLVCAGTWANAQNNSPAASQAAYEKALNESIPEPPPVAVGSATTPELPANAPVAIPSMPTARMELKWSDLSDLLNGILREKWEQAVKVSAPEMPIPAAVTRAAYQAVKRNDKQITVEGRFDIEVYQKTGWVNVPVAGNGVAAVEAKLDGKSVSLVPVEGEGYGVLIDAPGPHQATLLFQTKCATENGEGNFTFPCVRTAVTLLDLYLPEAGDAFVAENAAAIATEKPEGGVPLPESMLEGGTPASAAMRVKLVFPPSETIAVKWTIPAVLAEEMKIKQQEQQKVECRTTANVSTLAQISERFVLCYAKVEYDILRGETDLFTMRLPKDVNLLDVSGTGMVWTATPADADQLIEVRVNHKVTDRYELMVRYELPIEAGAKQVSAPSLAMDKADRLVGYVGVCTRDAMELSLAADAKGITRIDRSELPNTVQSLSSRPILLACKYFQPGPDIRIDIRKLEDIAVRIAVIDNADFTTVLSKDGAQVTEAIFQVRNNEKQFLRVSLKPEAKVWAATVNGQPVKPAKDQEGADVLIPLSKSQPGPQSDSVPVSIIYEEKQKEAFKDKLDTRSLAVPRTDILVNRYEWTVYLPESRRFLRAKGDFERPEPMWREDREYAEKLGALGYMDSRSGMGGGMGGYGGMMSRKMAASQAAAAPMQQNAIANSQVLFESPAPAAAPPMLENAAKADSKEKYGDEAGTANDGLADAAAGVLPVRIDLPRAGIPIHFSRVLGGSDKELSLTLITFPRQWVTAVRIAAAVLTFLIGMTLSIRVWRSQIPLWRRILLLGILFVVCVAAIAANQPPQVGEYLGVAGKTLVIGFLFGGLVAFFRPRPCCESKPTTPVEGKTGPKNH